MIGTKNVTTIIFIPFPTMPTTDLTPMKVQGNNITQVFRAPIIFLLSTFLSIGPNFFERLHIAEVNRALARIPVPKVATRSPLKRMPVRPPVHDPSTCVICALIHAPAVAQFWTIPFLTPTAQIGCITLESRSASPLIRISSPLCRGPPTA